MFSDKQKIRSSCNDSYIWWVLWHMRYLTLTLPTVISTIQHKAHQHRARTVSNLTVSEIVLIVWSWTKALSLLPFFKYFALYGLFKVWFFSIFFVGLFVSEVLSVVFFTFKVSHNHRWCFCTHTFVGEFVTNQGELLKRLEVCC